MGDCTGEESRGGDVTVKLYDFQERAVANVVDSLRRERVLLVSPTGSGKTVMGAHIVDRMAARRVLWLAHTGELVEQAAEHLRGLGMRVGVIADGLERAGIKPDPMAPVQVATIQTAVRRSSVARSAVDLIVIDEAHRAAADSYRKILVRMPTARLLGLTATPIRYDGKPLRQSFDSMIEAAKPSELFPLGLLARPETYSISKRDRDFLVDRLATVRRRGGDFEPAQLDVAMNHQTLVGSVVGDFLRYIPNGPAVVYGASVAHSMAIRDALRAVGVNAEHLDGTTPIHDRRQMLADLRDGRIEAVCNYAVLTEGWDLPSLAGVVLARATYSFGLYMQMVGRCMRAHNGRTPIVVDHGMNWERHASIPGADVDWSLEGGRVGRGEAKNSNASGTERPRVDPIEEWHPLRRLDVVDEVRVTKLRTIARRIGAPDEWAVRLARMAG
jgi:DNA repair protein RadD